MTNEDPTAVISTILLGRGQMPTFADTLSTEQIAAVTSYIRTAWDNNAAVVMPEQVSQVADGGTAATTAETTTDDTAEDAAAEKPTAQEVTTEETGEESGVTTTEEGGAAQNTPAATTTMTATATVTTTAQATTTTATPPVPVTAPTIATTTTATATATLPTSAGATWTPAPVVTATIAATSVATGTPAAPTATGNAAPQAQATPAATTAAEESAAEQLISQGEAVYAQNCASCHQLNGAGTSSYPALNNNELVTSEDPSAALTVILQGRGQMPAFADTLSEEEIAAVLSYVRNAWDNNAAVVAVEQVTQGGDASAGSMTTQSDTESAGAATTATPNATASLTTTLNPTATNALTATSASTPAPDNANQDDSAAASEDTVQTNEEGNPTPGATGTVTATAAMTATTTAEGVAPAASDEDMAAGVPKQVESVVEPPEQDTMTSMNEAVEEATPVSPEALITMGENLYTMNCAACHQAEGQGIAGAYPPLAGNAFVTTADPPPVIQVVITGRAGMPRFSGDLSAQEIAAILSYVRNTWGNEAAPVTVEQVRSVREEVSGGAESGSH